MYDGRGQVTNSDLPKKHDLRPRGFTEGKRVAVWGPTCSLQHAAGTASLDLQVELCVCSALVLMGPCLSGILKQERLQHVRTLP
jgi:hypothetical protein